MPRVSTRIRLLRACYSFLLPVARLLLRSGISYKEFAEISRVAFVSVAGSDYGIRGRPTNVSRISAMTGIGRKEVRRLRQLAHEYPDDPRVELNPLSDVLHRWYTDPVYRGRDGFPKRLRYKGGKVSFSTLVRACAGDLPVGAIRVELIRTGAVVVDADGRLLPKRRHNVPDSVDDAVITGLVFGLRALASTVAFNTGVSRPQVGRIERFAESNPLGEGVDLDEIRCQLRGRITDFSSGIDDFFSKIAQSSDRSAKRIGVGVYYYEDD
jgi:hypothetical protein